MEKLEELKKVIIKANPEIVELKFGCKFTLINEHWKKKDNFICKVVGKNIWAAIDNEECGHSLEEIEKEGKFEGSGDFIGKIIGRDIQFGDILITWESKNENKKMKLEVVMAKLFLIYSGWNLKENLDGQDKKTISFLYDLLVKN
jgi:hypothetical protein